MMDVKKIVQKVFKKANNGCVVFLKINGKKYSIDIISHKPVSFFIIASHLLPLVYDCFCRLKEGGDLKKYKGCPPLPVILKELGKGWNNQFKKGSKLRIKNLCLS